MEKKFCQFEINVDVRNLLEFETKFFFLSYSSEIWTNTWDAQKRQIDMIFEISIYLEPEKKYYERLRYEPSLETKKDIID